MCKVLCKDCDVLVTPHAETENYGADADGNRGEERTDWTCPDCGGDDLVEYEECSRCGKAIEVKTRYCTACKGDLMGANHKHIDMMSMEYDEDYVKETLVELLEG